MRTIFGKFSVGTRPLGILGALIIGSLLGASIVAAEAPSPASALSGSEFNAGLIIPDSLFYNSAAMTEAEIQGFLAEKGSALSAMTFSVSSRSRLVSESTGNVRCEAFQGGVLSAASIIYRAQAACGISARVLLVTLQKEQGLVTKSAPSQGALDRAMGFACPDTAPCAPTTLGFGNQVYSGALQLNTYKASRFGMQPGLHTIQWHPNAACGSSQVNVQNYATAALYNYTPYQPNQAALANLGGLGDSCSSYGNRNFWTFYQNWFGSYFGLMPYSVTRPVVSGPSTIGATLTVQLGSWLGSPSFSYVWLVCASRQDTPFEVAPNGCSVIPGATTASYQTTPGNAGKFIAVLVTGSNSYGTLSAGSFMAVPVGNPFNVVAPVVSGSATVGSTWTVNPGTWTGSPSPTIVVFWLRCDQPLTAGYTTVPAGCTAISGANGTTYVSSSADSGKYLTAQVAGNSSLGFALAGAISVTPVGFPVNTVAPVVSGSPDVGSTWTVNLGTWTGSPAPTMVIFWLRCDQPVTAGYTTVPAGCTAISGANGTTFVSSMADVGKYLTAQVAGNSSLGFALAGAINSTNIRTAVPASVVAPTVSGSATVGSNWTVNPGTWTGSPAPTLVIFWLRCNQPVTAGYTTVPAGCTAISGANGTTYVSTATDAGKYLTAQVSGNNIVGFGLAGAINTNRIQIAVPANVVAPTVSGSSAVGSTWTVNPGTWTGSPAPTMVIFWLRCDRPVTAGYTTVPAGCMAIPGANAITYVAAAADSGKYLTAQVAGNSPVGFALAGAISTTPVGFPMNAVAPTVSGSSAVGSTWTVNPGTWTGSPAPTLAIFWLRCDQPVTAGYTTVPAGCMAIPGANATTYVAAAADSGKYLTAQVAGNSPVGFALAGATNSTSIQPI